MPVTRGVEGRAERRSDVGAAAVVGGTQVETSQPVVGAGWADEEAEAEVGA